MKIYRVSETLSRRFSAAQARDGRREGLCGLVRRGAVEAGGHLVQRARACVGLHITLGGGFHTSQISQETLGNP